MATYQILSDIHFYSSGWDTFSLGSTATGGPFAGVNNTDWRTILGVTITPAANEKVTSFTLNVGFIKQYSEYGNNMKFGGYLYTSLDTAKNVSGPPSGYIAHFEESTATYTSYSGRMVDMTFSGLNITDTTTLYIWFYVTPSQYCQIWTSKSGNVVAPTITLTTATLTSACTPPASVSASGIVKPNGSFTVSWKEGGKGTGNSINGYRIYYRVSSNGAAPTTSTYTGYKDVSSTATSGSTTITLSNATRGYKVVCGVVTKGTAGSSYWSSMKTSDSDKPVIINSLPAAPSVSIDKTIVPSSGGTVTFTVNAGADSDSSQSRSVWYSTSSTGTKTMVSGDTLSATTPGTYYFWTSDGLEYSSSYISKSFSKNTIPKIESLNITPITYSANRVNGYAKDLALTYTLNKSSGTLYTYIQVGDKIETITTTVSSATTKVNLNINNYLTKYYKQTALNYKVYGKFNDGIENSANSSISEYALSAPPAITEWDNGLDGPTNTTDFYFSKKLTIYYNEDTEITSRTITSNLGQISNAKYYSDHVIFDLINYTGGGNVNFTINFYNGYFNKTSTITLKQITPITLENPSISKNYIDYFSTGSTAINLKCGWPFIDATGKEYGFNGLTDNNTLAIIEYGGKTSDIYGAVTKEGDFLQIAFSEEKLRIHDAALSEAYLGQHDFNIKLQVTNRFGDKINSEILSITINYNTEPVWDLNGFISNCNGTNKIQEDKELIFTLKFSTYTQENVKASIYIDRTGSGVYVLYDEIIFSGLGYNDNPKNSRQRNFIIPEIADSNNRAFYCVLTGQSSGLSARSDTLNIPVLRHTTPQNFSFTKVAPTAEGGTVEYTLDNLGYDEGSEGTYELKITNTQDDVKDIKNNSWIGELASTTYQLILTTTVADKIKTFYSNILLYFTDVPTVSYRKNLIGINFDGIDEVENNNSLVIISQYDNKKDITFYGYNEGVLTKRTIDLSTGALSGFIIDGGSW